LDTSLGAERFLRNDGALDPGQLTWLEDLLLNAGGRRSILMSHHFIVSDWDSPAASLLQQVGELVKNRIVAWYWGHEHKMATYGHDPHGFHGACVGNGAYLEKWVGLQRSVSSTWYADSRCQCYLPKSAAYWAHGFLELELRDDRVEEVYHLEGGDTHTRTLSV
ncbi:MAG: hypothetical protein ACRDGM_16095, partial [bacterium]